MNTLFLPLQKCLRSQLMVELIAMCILFVAAMSVFGTSGGAWRVGLVWRMWCLAGSMPD